MVIWLLTRFLSDSIDDIKSAYDSLKDEAIDFAEQVNKTVTKLADDLKEEMKIAAQLTKIENLQKSMRKQEENIREMVSRILNQASGIASQVSRNYSEHDVQAQLRNLDHLSDTIRSDHKQLSAAIDQKIKAIQFSTTRYREIESNLSLTTYK